MELGSNEPIEIRIPGGGQADLWSGINVGGEIHLLIRNRSGSNSLRAWWITWGISTVRQLGLLTDAQTLVVPIRWWQGLIAARLRAAADQDTVVYVSDKIAIDYSKTFVW